MPRISRFTLHNQMSKNKITSLQKQAVYSAYNSQENFLIKRKMFMWHYLCLLSAGLA